MLTGKNKYGEKIMENKIIRILAWVQFLLTFSLVMVHMFRYLHWLPLTILLIPSAMMIMSVEKEWE